MERAPGTKRQQAGLSLCALFKQCKDEGGFEMNTAPGLLLLKRKK